MATETPTKAGGHVDHKYYSSATFSPSPPPSRKMEVAKPENSAFFNSTTEQRRTGEDKASSISAFDVLEGLTNQIRDCIAHLGSSHSDRIENDEGPTNKSKRKTDTSAVLLIKEQVEALRALCSRNLTRLAESGEQCLASSDGRSEKEERPSIARSDYTHDTGRGFCDANNDFPLPHHAQLIFLATSGALSLQIVCNKGEKISGGEKSKEAKAAPQLRLPSLSVEHLERLHNNGNANRAGIDEGHSADEAEALERQQRHHLQFADRNERVGGGVGADSFTPHSGRHRRLSSTFGGGVGSTSPRSAATSTSASGRLHTGRKPAAGHSALSSAAISPMRRGGGAGGGGSLGGHATNGLVSSSSRQRESLSMAPGVSLSETETASYGQCISAAIYLILESILVRTESDRLSLFLPISDAYGTKGSIVTDGGVVGGSGGHLCLVANVGAGTHPVTREHLRVGQSSVVQKVFTTRIAANLRSADLDDVAECRGPSAPHNSLIFPIRSVAHPYPPSSPFGVIQLVNKRKGTTPYASEDELMLHVVGPSIAAILERYPTRLTNFPFNVAPLHLWSPLPSYRKPMIDVAESLSAEPTQLVFRRGGGDEGTSKQTSSILAASSGKKSAALWANLARDVNTTPAATHLEDVEKHLRILEDCWRSSVAENMKLERLVEQKEHHIHDARDIITRKQKKLELMKNVLCDEIARHLKGESALTKTAGGM